MFLYFTQVNVAIFALWILLHSDYYDIRSVSYTNSIHARTIRYFLLLLVFIDENELFANWLIRILLHSSYPLEKKTKPVHNVCVFVTYDL